MPGVIVRFSIGRSATAALSEVAVRRLTSLPAATPPPSSGTRSSQPPSILVKAIRLIPTQSFTSGAETLRQADQPAAPLDRQRVACSELVEVRVDFGDRRTIT